MTAQPAIDVAASVHRLAVLLEAGLAPARAWEQLAHAGDRDAAAVVARMHGIRGDGVASADGVGGVGGAATRPDLPDAIAARGGVWTQVGQAWRVAATVGAPLAASLRDIADALRDAEQSRDDVRVALAEPAATARLVAWLPLVAVGLVAALGFDIVAAVTQPLGLAALAGGLVLMALARRWTARLVARAQPDDAIPGLACDVMAIALSGGLSIDRSRAAVAAAGTDGGRARDVDAGTGIGVAGGATADAADADVEAALALSAASGAPAVELLRAAAAEARRRARTEGRTRAARLSSSLLLPLGVCTLPSFLLLGVVPMMLSVLAATPLML